ncbi:metallophosphoesterase [Natrialbaceae archaeon GCM10025810]|uniref:metallophosphoesterase n=1 Tax=Halovalidus salilacus TaxID=3075124 RepID=UPI00360FB605
MIAIFSDTHSVRGHELEGEAFAAAREADRVIHAGDFTSVAALEAFRGECGTLLAVHGNADDPAVADRLPTERVVEVPVGSDDSTDATDRTVRIAVTHRRDGGETGLAMFGRSRGADVVVFGHSHRPTVVETEDVLLLNPGSHAQPRGNRPGFAVLEPRADGDGLEGRVLGPDGTLLESFDVPR